MASPAPYHLPLATALQRSEPLGALMQRLRDSQARFEVITPLLPAALRQAVKPGPLDETSWVLLAAHASAAAKLRQMLPQLEASLATAGWQGPALRVKVSSAA